MVRDTGSCYPCGQAAVMWAYLRPDARRWLSEWADRLRFAIEAADLPTDARSDPDTLGIRVR